MKDLLNKPAANSTFAIGGVSCFADTFVHGGSSVLRMEFSAKIPAIANPRNFIANAKEIYYEKAKSNEIKDNHNFTHSIYLYNKLWKLENHF